MITYWLNPPGNTWLDIAMLIAIGFLIYGPVMMIALAGALLVMPRPLTDAFGLLLLMPWGRRQVGAYFRRHYVAKFQVHDARLRPQSPPQDMPEADPDRWPNPQTSERLLHFSEKAIKNPKSSVFCGVK